MFREAVPGKYAKRSACLVAERKLSGHQFRAGRGSRCSHAPGNFSRRGYAGGIIKNIINKGAE